MRTFVALNLPPSERVLLHDAVESLRVPHLPVRWVEADAIHLTLKFIGDIEGAEVPRLDDALRSIAANHPPIRLRIAGFGAFPSLRRATVLWIGVQPDPGIMALQRDIELALSRLGYLREQRPFRPHITLGRARGDGRALDVERHVTGVRYQSEVIVETVDLMRSHVSAGGSRYEVLLRHALGAQAAT